MTSEHHFCGDPTTWWSFDYGRQSTLFRHLQDVTPILAALDSAVVLVLSGRVCLWGGDVDQVDFHVRHQLLPLLSQGQSNVVQVEVHPCMVFHDAPFWRKRNRTQGMIWTSAAIVNIMETLIRIYTVDGAQYIED